MRKRGTGSSLTFPEKAVMVCCAAMRSGTVRPFHIRRVIQYEKVDVSPIRRFLKKEHPEYVRRAAVKIIGEKGDATELIDVALNDPCRVVVLEALSHLHRVAEKLEGVAELLNSEDEMIKEAAMQLFRRANRGDCLYILLFEEDKHMVRRVHRAIKAEKDAEKGS